MWLFTVQFCLTNNHHHHAVLEKSSPVSEFHQHWCREWRARQGTELRHVRKCQKRLQEKHLDLSSHKKHYFWIDINRITNKTSDSQNSGWKSLYGKKWFQYSPWLLQYWLYRWGFIGNSVDSEVSAASVGISSAYTAVRLPPDVIVIINAAEHLRSLFPGCGIIWCSNLDFSLHAFRLRVEYFFLEPVRDDEIQEGLRAWFRLKKTII